MPVKLLFLSILLFVFSENSLLNAQSHIENQLLVQLNDREKIADIISEIKTKFYIDTDINVELITRTPIIIWKLEFAEGLKNMRNIIHFLNSHEHVVNAQFNHVIEPRNIPNDPQFGQQWHLKNTGQGGGNPGSDIDAERAWDLTTGGITPLGDTIVICVIDNGLDLNHEDIQGNIWINHNEIPGNGIDDDNNGYIDDYYGWNSVDKNGNISKGAHGTQASGLIGAKGNNNKGVAGINWDIKIMPVIFGGSEAQALASYSYAYQMRKIYNESGGERGAFIVATNSSFGINYAKAEDYPIWCSMYDSLGSVGILNIVATSNANINVDEVGDMPSTCPSEFIIAVTNIDRNDNKAPSGFGLKNIDIGAYGSGVLTIRPDNRYNTFNGTSAAAPIVTGIVGLIYSYSQKIAEMALESPAAAALMAKGAILEGSRPIGSLKDITVTGAAANAYGALRSVEKYDSDCAPPYLINIDTVGADLIGLSWSYDSTKNYNLKYRYENYDWLTIENINSPYVLEGLDFCSIIEFSIQQVCDDIAGEFGYFVKATTLGCCTSPAIFDHYIENGKLHIEWESIYAADNYTISYKYWPDPVWNSVTTTDNTYTIDMETDCGMYIIKVQSECKVGLSEEKPHYVLGMKCTDCDIAQYCFPEMNNDFEWIEQIRIGNFVNMSGKNLSGYGVYSHTPAIKFIENEYYTMEVDIGFRNFEFKDSVYLWIDLNRDGVFQRNEMLAKGSNDDSRSVKLVFTIPGLPVEGHTRMRVMLNSNSNSSPCDIGNFDYGEYEDYCVILGKNTLCDIQDINVSVEYSVAEGPILKWNDKGQIYRYMVSIRNLDDDTEFIPLAFTEENELNISLLDTCTNYEIRIEVYCSPFDISQSFYHNFRTQCSDNITELIPENLIIFPNPASDLLNIIFRNDIGVYDLKLTDTSGRQVMAKPGISGNTSLKLDESNLGSGVYILHLSTGDQVFNYKIIKLK